MLTTNSKSRFISWQELEEMIFSLSQEIPFSDIWPHDERAQIPARMLIVRTGGEININGKRFDIFSGTGIDICLFKIFNEDEARYIPWDNVFYEEIIVPIDEQPPQIIMPWEKV